MNSLTDIKELLCLITAPALYVVEDCVQLCNDAAIRLFIEAGDSVAELFSIEKNEFKNLKEGCMFISIHHNGIPYGATVRPVQKGCIIILDTDRDNQELKTLALTASNMRQPLSAMIASADNLAQQLSNSQDPRVREHLNYLNRNLSRMHRTLCNMSDVLQYTDGNSGTMAMQDIVSVLSAVFQHAQALAGHNNITLEYSLPAEAIYGVIDAQLLERAVYNMFSNAFKFTEAGGHIQAKVAHNGHCVSISVADNGCGIQPQLMTNIFQRYQRQPGLEDGRFGLGLGLALVRCAAAVHFGTVLLDQQNGSGTRITLNIPIKQTATAVLHSGGLSVDYAGGWDHALLELSDVLPAHLYQNRS